MAARQQDAYSNPDTDTKFDATATEVKNSCSTLFDAKQINEQSIKQPIDDIDKDLSSSGENKFEELMETVRNSIHSIVSTEVETKVKDFVKELESNKQLYEEAKAKSTEVETKVKDFVEELESTKQLYEEAKAKSQKMERRVKELEEELASTKIQYKEANDTKEKYKNLIEIQQIKAYHINEEHQDDYIKKRMCDNCHGWTKHRAYGFDCNCDGLKCKKN